MKIILTNENNPDQRRKFWQTGEKRICCAVNLSSYITRFFLLIVWLKKNSTVPCTEGVEYFPVLRVKKTPITVLTVVSIKVITVAVATLDDASFRERVSVPAVSLLITTTSSPWWTIATTLDSDGSALSSNLSRSAQENGLKKDPADARCFSGCSSQICARDQQGKLRSVGKSLISLYFWDNGGMKELS